MRTLKNKAACTAGSNDISCSGILRSLRTIFVETNIQKNVQNFENPISLKRYRASIWDTVFIPRAQ